MLKGKYQEKKLTEFYKCLINNEYAQAKSYANKLKSLSEKAFSKIKYVKFYHKPTMTNEHLSSIWVRITNF